MKNIFRYIAGTLFAGLVMTACSPEEFEGASQDGMPKLSDYKAVVTVDQETNIATFNMVDNEGNSPKGVYPIWEVNISPFFKSTVNGCKSPFIIFAGEYSYTLKVGNRNGISDGIAEGTFTINTTRFDFSNAVAKLTGNASKEWRVFSAQAGHLACGETPQNPAGWWSAAPNDKAAEGIYDDRITFAAGSILSEGAYVYSAGEDGTTFCNKGVTALGVTGAAEDYSVPCVGVNGAQTEVTYHLGYDDAMDCITITLPAKTLFPYIADDAQMNGATTFFMTEMTDKTMTWVIQLPGICWQIIFVNGADPVIEFDPNKVNWCAPDAPENLGAAFNTKGAMTFWFADADWAQIGNPDFSFADGVYKITTKDATAAEWQGQCVIGGVPLKIDGGEYYDISCKIVASQSVDRLTVKINKDPDVDGDPNSLFYKGNFSLEAGENTLRFAKASAVNSQTKEPVSFDQAKFIIDLGGTPAGVTVELSDIIVQKHNPK